MYSLTFSYTFHKNMNLDNYIYDASGLCGGLGGPHLKPQRLHG